MRMQPISREHHQSVGFYTFLGKASKAVECNQSRLKGIQSTPIHLTFVTFMIINSTLHGEEFEKFVKLVS